LLRQFVACENGSVAVTTRLLFVSIGSPALAGDVQLAKSPWQPVLREEIQNAQTVRNEVRTHGKDERVPVKSFYRGQ
jgi:hypothetical protein